MYTLDTNAIIYYVQEDVQAISTLEEIYARNVPVYVSVMTEAELFAFSNMSDQEAERIEQFLKTVSVIPMKMADSVIAATALFTGTRLVTRNTQDFLKIPHLLIEEV